MKKSRELNMSIPEVTDKIDVREISENFEIIDKILSANLVKRNTSTTEINVTAYPPYYIMKNTENNPIDYFDPIFEETFTLGPLEEKKFFINAPQSLYFTSDVQIEYDYFIPIQEAIASAIETLDVPAVSVGTAETIKSISETDGKIAVTKQSIAIKSNQVNKMTSYSKATSPSAIATSDSLNAAVGKLEYKVDTNETNISNANTQIADIYNRCGGGKNLFNFTAKKSATFRGITLTNNNDGTFAVSGTSTEKDAYHDFYYSETNIPSNFKKGKTYRMVISGSNNTVAFKVLFYTSSWSAPISTFSNQSFTIPTNATGMIIRISISNANTVVNSTISLMITEQFISDNEVVPYVLTNAEIQDFLAVKTYNHLCFVQSVQELVVREEMNLKESGYAWVFDLYITYINGVEANTKTKLGTVTPAPPRALVKHNVTIMKNDNSGVITNDAIIKITTDGSLYITSPVAIRPTGTGEYGRIESNGTCIFEAIKL